MGESESMGVQCVARERDFEWRIVPGSIDGLADDRMSDFGQVDADLVGTAGLQSACEAGRRVAKFLDDLIVRDGGSAVHGSASYPSPAIASIGDQRQIDSAPRGVKMPLDNREIDPLDGMSAEQCLEWTQRPW
jgi:hypothetical protein